MVPHVTILQTMPSSLCTKQWGSQIWYCILPNARSQTCLGGGEARQTLKMIGARTLSTALDLHEYCM